MKRLIISACVGMIIGLSASASIILWISSPNGDFGDQYMGVSYIAGILGAPITFLFDILLYSSPFLWPHHLIGFMQVSDLLAIAIQWAIWGICVDYYLVLPWITSPKNYIVLDRPRWYSVVLSGFSLFVAAWIIYLISSRDYHNMQGGFAVPSLLWIIVASIIAAVIIATVCANFARNKAIGTHKAHKIVFCTVMLVYLSCFLF